jgi:hypothetical protein
MAKKTLICLIMPSDIRIASYKFCDNDMLPFDDWGNHIICLSVYGNMCFFKGLSCRFFFFLI